MKHLTFLAVPIAVLKTISIALLCGAAVLLYGAAEPTGPAPSQPSQATPYHYVLPLSLSLEAATEAIRVCAENGYRVTATVVDMDGVPQVALRGDGATIHTAESSFEKAFTVVTLGPIFDFDTSGKFFDLVKTNPYAPRLATVRNVMALPGRWGSRRRMSSWALWVWEGLPAEIRMKSAHKLVWRKSPTGFQSE